MQFLPDWAPGIHPLVIHFPIALIAIAIAFDIYSLFRKSVHINISAVILYVAGTLGALAAFFSGRDAADMLKIPEGNYDIYPAISSHADLAYYTILFFSIYSILRVIVYKYFEGKNLLVSIVMLIVGIFGYYLVFQTADKGAELVYRYGAGTQLFTQKSNNAEKADDKIGFIEKKDGSWEWQANNDPEKTLLTNFRLLNGTPNNLEISNESGYIKISPANGNSYFFVYQSEGSDLVLNAKVDLSQFAGSFSLIHHVTDKLNYDFFDINGKEVRLGRQKDGKLTIFDQSSYNKSGWITLKAVAAKDHFRGYINDSLVVHGHGKELPPGYSGFLFSGTGDIFINNLKATFSSEKTMDNNH